MNSQVVHFLLTESVPFPWAMTVNLAQVLLCDVAAVGVSAVGSRERLPVDCSSFMCFVLMSVFACLYPYFMCECVRGAEARWPDAERWGEVLSLKYLSAQVWEWHLPNFHTRPLPQRAKKQRRGHMCIKRCLPFQQLCHLEVILISLDR